MRQICRTRSSECSSLVLKDKVLAADNGLLAADLAGNAVGDDVLHLTVHLVVADALCGSGLHDAFAIEWG